MADSKLITHKHLQMSNEKIAAELEKIHEEEKADDTAFTSVSIPVSAWTANTDEETLAIGLSYCAVISVEGVEAVDSADTFLDFGCMDTAREIGMANVARSGDGTITYYATDIPDAEITAQIRIIQG